MNNLRVPSSECVSSCNSGLWMIAALLAVLFLALPNLQYPIGRDQATYCVIAQGLLQGKQLYRNLWDNKPPGIFYIYIPIVKLFGQALWSVGVVDILCVLTLSVCTFSFCRRYLGPPAAAIAAVLYAYLHNRPGYINAAQPEAFLMLFVFAAFFLLAGQKRGTGSRNFAAGFSLALAFWTKYNALVFLPLVVFLPYLETSRLDARAPRLALNVPWKVWATRTTFLLAGFGAAVGGVLAYFQLSGAWPAMKEVQFEVLPRYGTMVIDRTPHYFLWALGQTTFNLGTWTEAGVAVGLLIAWRCREIQRTAPIFLAALAGYLATATQARFNAYSFETCLPFLAMIWAYAVVRTFQGFRKVSKNFKQRGWSAARLGVWIVFLNLLYFPLPVPAMKQMEHYQGLVKWWRNPEKSYESYWWALNLEHLRGEFQVIRYLREHDAAGDRVFIWGTAPLIYFLSGHECPSRFVSNLGLISAWAPTAWRTELMSDLRKTPPRYIVVARHDAISAVSYTTLDSQELLVQFSALAGLLQSQYAPVKSFQDFVIYTRRELPSTAGVR
ncbi:MAG TPA: glycosyltransferase family 39 protein [Terriglobia bacterium]|nr:glycosyltransferase family 39 protein [Terriglobia bacterium]